MVLQPSTRPLAERYPLGMGLLTSGVSVASASALTNPFDVVKVRLQLQALTGGPPLGMLSTFQGIWRTEGLLALWHGVTPAIGRGLFYGAVRIGMYKPLLGVLPIESQPVQKVTAGCISGALAAAVFNPFDLVKTRLQAKTAAPQSMGSIIKTVVAENGVTGLWRGTVPSAIRAGVLTAAQCATYDVTKRKMIAMTGWGDNMGTQLLTSMATGLITTTATAPVDTIKSRVFVEGASGGGSMATVMRIARNEGMAGFFKGWSAQYLRLGPQTTITFLVMERVRAAAGMSSF
uniref:Mitochondrial carrier protein n=1 Tax=Tetraselmis chuii TaxID=63592 RepID=A0A7S1SWZ6_9CHLO